MDANGRTESVRDFRLDVGIVVASTDRPSRTPGYRMIESLEVSDFRCFKSLKLSGLRRVNVLTGANGSGKTAVLEALYLGTGATGAALQAINASRANSLGTPAPVIIGNVATFTSGPVQSLEAMFGHLFRTWRKDTSGNPLVPPVVETAKKIEISFVNSDNEKYSLKLAFQGRDDAAPVPVVRVAGGRAESSPLVLTRSHEVVGISGVSLTNIPITLNQFGQLQHPPVHPLGPSTMTFGPGMDYAEIDDVAWFSQLKERHEADGVIAFIRSEFPFIRDIEVLAPAGASGVYAVMADGTTRRVSLVSSGIYKILSILLACAHTRDGIILIDEIENGLFYEKYQAMWAVLYKFASQTNNQIFASCHSAECLQALVPAMGEQVDDFCLLRSEQEKNECSVRHISGAAMLAALRGSNEVRGATLGFKSHNP